MAKQNRYANKAAQHIEVAGRTLRTNSPEHVRMMLELAEQRKLIEPGFVERIQDRGAYKGAAFEAIRLKGIS